MFACECSHKFYKLNLKYLMNKLMLSKNEYGDFLMILK